MNAGTLALTLLWLLAGIIVVGAVVCVLVRRTAARILVASLAVLVGLVVLGAHLQVRSVASNHVNELCRDGVHWFGITLGAPADQCDQYL